MRRFAKLLDKYGKFCPKCGSGEVSSDNSTPLNHRCLDCGHKFVDAEAIIGNPRRAASPATAHQSKEGFGS